MQQKPAPSNFPEGQITGVIIRALKRFYDDRGWLSELFRRDEFDVEFLPAMAYISATKPGVTRGPHEHVDQADVFCFLGPSNFKVRMWDNRPDSDTYGNRMTLVAGADNPRLVLIPKGIVHAYQNVGEVDGIVVNCPNRLYMGDRRQEKIDEIRHEDDPNTIFRMDD